MKVVNELMNSISRANPGRGRFNYFATVSMVRSYMKIHVRKYITVVCTAQFCQ